MAATIKIKRSGTNANGSPNTLASGELAYNYKDTIGGKLYIGWGDETTPGEADNIAVIGGKFFTDMLDHTAGTLTASSAIIVGSDSKIDVLNVDNLTLNDNTLSSTDTNGNILITPNGTGKTVVTNLYIGDVNTPLSEYIFDTVGGAITAGTGITITNNDGANTSTVSITNTGVTAQSYGSSTAIPVITVNAQGQITAASTATISTTLNIAGTSGTGSVALGSQTLTVTGNSPISVAAANQTLTISAADATTTTKGVASFATANFTVTSGAVTTKNITLGTSTLTNGSTTLSIAGLQQLTVDNIDINGNTISSTDTNGNIIFDPNGTGYIDVSSARITNLAEPVNASDAATKYYVDAVKTGLDVKSSVRVATTANITLSGTQTIDGVALSVGNRVLVKNQTDGTQNGIYDVASSTWARSSDADNTPTGEVTSGMFTFVEEGTTNSDSGWVLATNDPITLGTTSLSFVQFSGTGQITAGAGLTKTGNTLDVGGTANRITVNADTVDIASTYVGQSSITTLGTVTTGTWNADVIAGQYGGTGVANTGKTITLGGNLTTSGAYALTLTLTNTTSITLPTTGTLATLAGTETLTNKTMSTGSTWNGNTVTVPYGGTGLTTITTNGIVYGNGTSAAGVTAAGTWDTVNLVGQILSVNASGVPTWTNTIDGGTYS